jgi:hypothetical protein
MDVSLTIELAPGVIALLDELVELGLWGLARGAGREPGHPGRGPDDGNPRLCPAAARGHKAPARGLAGAGARRTEAA